MLFDWNDDVIFVLILVANEKFNFAFFLNVILGKGLKVSASQKRVKTWHFEKIQG